MQEMAMYRLVALQEFQAQPPDMPLASAVWDLEHTTAPESLLQPLSQLTCACPVT